MAVLTAQTFSTITAGETHTCGLTTSNAVYCWGDNTYGQLGTGNKNTSWLPIPSLVISGETVVDITTGKHHTCVQTQSGKAYCWGNNANRQLGNGTNNADSTSPTLVVDSGALNGVSITQVSANGDISCALGNNNRIYCWGDGNNGQLGNNGWTTSNVPVAVDNTGVLSGATIARVEVGVTHVCALDTTGDAYCWGYNGVGQLGNNAAGSDSGVPVAVIMNGLSFSDLSLGHQHACAIAEDNSSHCWGFNYYGTLGNGVSGAGINSAHPVASTLPSSPIPYAATLGGTLASIDTRSNTAITLTTPPHTPGLVDIVLTAGGFPTISLTDAYTYTDTTNPSYGVYRFGPTPGPVFSISANSLVYRVVFNEPVVAFNSVNDLTLITTNTAHGTISQIIPINEEEYYVIVTGVSGSGNIQVQLAPLHDVEDLAGNPANTAPDFSQHFAIDPANTPMPTVHPLFSDNDTPTITGTWHEGTHTALSVTINGTTYTLGTDPQLTSNGSGTWTLNLTGTTPLIPASYTVRAQSMYAGFPRSNASLEEVVILDVQKVSSRTDVSAFVNEALILLLDATAIFLEADPLSNAGQVNNQSSLLTVYSNARSGYSISANLRDALGEAQLRDGSTGATIPSNILAGDNYFSYFARNTGSITPSNAEYDFQKDPTQLLGNGSEVIGYDNTTDGQEHRIGYDLNVNFLTPAGMYAGTVYYTVIANF